MRIVLATHNAHKVTELRAILGPLLGEHELVSLGDVPGGDGPEPVEDGLSYAENALIKARAAAATTGLAAIADDSGIEVEHLDGAPGIHSARYAGTRDDADNRDLLLARMTGVAERRATFQCAAAFANPGDGRGGRAREVVQLGSWGGTLLERATGEGGFGYDPVFRPEGETRSAAELSPAEKNAVSHRARAFTALWTRIGPELDASA
ncbi:MAG: RdgB/HAM1 family non-canonical purine NTP pyrophosphatase [Micrococcales bacterium]|nr:RdgB/HAM1 family non-canonical purine NTP pyrophosphatase [Micrococcales bacterium]